MTRLETLAQLSVIAVSCVALALLLEQRFRPASAPSSREAVERSLKGRVLALPDVHWNSKPRALVLQISTTCHFCMESEPFYKQLSAARLSLANHPALVVATADDPNVMRSYLKAAGLTVDQIVSIGPGATGTGATPVIFIVGKAGVVERAFVGKLDPASEKEVLSASRS